ncbi:MAG: multidrug effflux MFS transporter [Rickettsia endosymbiont of Pentastiridius leporinus]
MRFEELKILTVLVLVACLSGFASDIYVPSFLIRTKELHSTLTGIQQSMSAFMISLAISQFVYGPLSEIIGRRLALLIGVFVMMAGSIVCSLAESLPQLIVGRFIQGAGAGACACLWRSIFKDIFNGQQITKYGGYLGVAMVYIVAASPFLGGYLEIYAGWRISFIAAMLYGLIVFVLVYIMLPETNADRTAERLKIKFFFNAYGQLLKSSVFMGYSLCVFFTYGAFFSWFVVGPVICTIYFKLSPENFGLLNFTLGGTAMAIGGIFNAKYVVRFGQDMMLRLGWSLIILSGFSMVILDLFSYLILTPFLVCIFTFLFGATLIWSNSFSRAFAPFGSIAGYAGSLYSSMQLGGGAIIGWVSAFIPDDRLYPLAVVFIVTALIAWLLFEYFAKQKVTNNNAA